MAYADYIHRHSGDAAHQAQTATEREMSTFFWLQIVLSFVFPPLAVFLERDAGVDLIICIALCCLAWVPGMIYAVYIVCKVSA